VPLTQASGPRFQDRASPRPISRCALRAPAAPRVVHCSASSHRGSRLARDRRARRAPARRVSGLRCRHSGVRHQAPAPQRAAMTSRGTAARRTRTRCYGSGSTTTDERLPRREVQRLGSPWSPVAPLATRSHDRVAAREHEQHALRVDVRRERQRSVTIPLLHRLEQPSRSCRRRRRAARRYA